MANKILFIHPNELIQIIKDEFKVPSSLESKTETIPDEDDLICDFVVLHPDWKDMDKILDLISDKTGINKMDISTDVDNKTGLTSIYIDYIDLKKILQKRFNIELKGSYDVCECNLFEDNIVIAFTIL